MRLLLELFQVRVESQSGEGEEVPNPSGEDAETGTGEMAFREWRVPKDDINTGKHVIVCHFTKWYNNSVEEQVMGHLLFLLSSSPLLLSRNMVGSFCRSYPFTGI